MLKNAATDGGNVRFAGCRGYRAAGWRTARSRHVGRCHRLPQTVCHFAPRTGSIVMSMSLCICLFVCPLAYLKNYAAELRQIPCAC